MSAEQAPDGPSFPLDVTANLDHLRRVGMKRLTLEAVTIDTEEATLRSLARALGDGSIDLDELARIYRFDYRPYALPGHTSRWDAVMPTYASARRLRDEKRWLANGPHGTWTGERHGGPYPPPGVPFVYVLYDAQNVPCYVGSSGHVSARLAVHRKDKPFVRWIAHPCRDREHAYAEETRLLREHKPYLNKRASR